MGNHLGYFGGMEMILALGYSPFRGFGMPFEVNTVYHAVELDIGARLVLERTITARMLGGTPRFDHEVSVYRVHKIGGFWGHSLRHKGYWFEERVSSDISMTDLDIMSSKVLNRARQELETPIFGR